MSLSADGILVFGVELGETLPPFMQGFDDFDDYVDSQTQAIGAKRYEARNAYIATLTMHCSLVSPMFILGLRSTEQLASGGYPSVANLATERLDEFKAWLLERGITKEPAWLLTSMYG